MGPLLSDNPSQWKLAQILRPDHPLVKTDIIWVLEYIKKRVAEEDPRLLELPQPRLLTNFRYFAEISMMLIHRRPFFDHEMNRLKTWMLEASHGLIDDRH